MAQELELKLALPARALSKVLAVPEVAAAVVKGLPAQRLYSVYFDTPEHALLEQGVAVRLRRQGRRWIQTVKTAGTAAGGLHNREEWESPGAENTLDFNSVADGALRKFLASENIAARLRPVYVTEISRARRVLRASDDSEIELAIDRGKIKAGAESLSIAEVELELKSGAPESLIALGRAIVGALPARLEHDSKAQRGVRLALRLPRTPRKAMAVDLSRHMAASEAFAAIVSACVQHMQGNETGLLQLDDPEYVHQARVALRRLRSAYSVFSGVPGHADDSALRAELRWLSKEFDGARNWDVFDEDILRLAARAFPNESGFGALQERVSAQRAQALARAREAVQSKRYQFLLLDLVSWIVARSAVREENSERRSADGTHLIELSSEILRRLHRRVKKRGANLESLSAEDRHGLRIAAKKLRYGVEFFSALFPANPVRKFQRAITGLQAVLGTLNDGVTAQGLLDTLALAELNERERATIVVLRGWLAGTEHAAAQALAEAWRRYTDAKKFW